MKECSKSIQRRLHTPAFANRYFVGNGIDIGGKPDPLGLYRDLFPRMQSCRTWDIEDGDAQYLAGIADNELDFVHSSHCLEHMADPRVALANWLRALKPGGHAIIMVPDEDMYEQGIWPSRFNHDHKWTFTIFKQRSWSPVSVNILELITDLGDACQLLRLERLVDTWRPVDALFDQTLTPVGECAIEFVLQKGGAKPMLREPDREMRIHFNQHLADQANLKAGNREAAPFKNDSPLPPKGACQD